VNRYLVLQLEAPLMSFGGPIVDNNNYTDDVPGRSMITGLLGNALGYEHAEMNKLKALQDRVAIAVRVDRPGHRLTDFHTVDLGQEHLFNPGWTTHHRKESRGGGLATRKGTHIRYRDFFADRLCTVVVGLKEASTGPTVDDLFAALEEPERPLFIGRKVALPSRPICGGLVEAESLAEALHKAPSDQRLDPKTPCFLPGGDPRQDGLDVLVRDQKDWHNQIHTGRRWIRRTTYAELSDV